MIELRHTKEIGETRMRLDKLEKMMEEMAGQPREERGARVPGETCMYERRREDLYAKDVIESFLPRKPTGELFEYTRYPTSGQPPETPVRPSLSD